ncbi:MAG: TolC family protein [Planctomycetota bacterium]
MKKALDIQQEITVNLLLWEKLKKIITIKRNKLVILERIKKYLVDSISFHQEEGYFNEIININLKITSITKEIATLKSTIKSIKNELGRLVYIKQYQKLALPGLKILHILGKRNIFRDLSLNPELLKYKQIIEKSRIEVDRSIKNFIPDITLNLGITLKSMDPVANFMGKKGLLSALMMNLPVYKEKLSAQIESRIFENYAARFELTMKEREILRDFFRNNIEFYLNKIILKIVDKEIKEVKTIKNYTKKLISLAKTNLINNLEIEIMLFDYIETRISYSYDKTIANLKNRFLVGKFILGGER